MNIQSSKRRLTLFCTILAIITVFITCRKIDYNRDKRLKIDHAAEFFKIPVNTNATIRRLAEAMKAYNNEHDFVSDFVKKHGLPKWDKCPKLLVGAPGTHKGEGGGYKDTVAFVPITNTWSGPGTAERVVSFLAARLTADSIQIRLFNTDEYAAYGMTDRTDTLSAEMIASFSMYLETLAVPDRDTFRVVDDRLFPSLPKNGDSSRLAYFTEQEGGHDKAQLSVPVETTSCFTYCHTVKCFKSATVSTDLYCYDVCYPFWSFIILDDPGIVIGPGGGGNGGGTGGLQTQANCSLYPQGVCGQAPILGWVPLHPDDEAFDPYVYDQIDFGQSLMDSFPCLYHFIHDSMTNDDPNKLAQLELYYAFNINQYVNLTFDIDWNLTHGNAHDTVARLFYDTAYYDNNADTMRFESIIHINPWYAANATREYLIGAIVHESIHAYIKYMFSLYQKQIIDSTYMIAHFPVQWSWWKHHVPSANTQHIQMAQAYRDFIAGIIRDHYNPAVSQNNKKIVPEAIAWEGLYEAGGWIGMPGSGTHITDTCKIKMINWAASHPDSSITATMAPTGCGSYHLPYNDSLQLHPPFNRTGPCN